MEVINRTGCVPATQTFSYTDENASTVTKTIDLGQCAEKVYIYSSPIGTVSDMHRIRLTGGPVGTSPVAVSLGFVFSQIGSPPTSVGANWGGLDARDLGNAQFYGGIGGSLVGTINVDQLFRFDANVAIQAEVRAGGAGNGGTFIVEAASIASNGSVVLEANNIGRVTVGSHAGRIEATAGTITTVEVANDVSGLIVATNGAIGTVTVGGQIQGPSSTVRVAAKTGIASVTASSIVGSISANSGGGTGKLKRLQTTTGAFSGNLACVAVESDLTNGGIFIAGDLTGELDVRSGGIKEPIVVTGNVASTGSISVTEGGALVDDSTHDGRITIGGALSGTITINQNQGIAGQVVVNAASQSSTWTGPVQSETGGSLLLLDDGASQPNQAPYYQRVSADLGGGAVGQVPFHTYDVDCNPPNDLPWDDLPGDNPLLNTAFSDGTRSATMKFYGPVRSAAPANAEPWEKPVTFWFWLNRASQWTNLTGVVDIEMAEQGSGALSREIRITGTGELLPPGFYAVTVNRTPRDVPNELYQYHAYCDGTLTTVPPAPAANIDGALEYHFRLWPDCDDNGVIDPVLTLCQGDPIGTCCADIAGGGVTGTDPDNAVDGNDLVVFLIWFEDGLTEVDIDDGTGTCTPDAAVDVNDLLYFLLRFEAGC